ncbi:MAG: hypothetical protein ACI901_001240 [Octadecabacter sp.]
MRYPTIKTTLEIDTLGVSRIASFDFIKLKCSVVVQEAVAEAANSLLKAIVANKDN